MTPLHRDIERWYCKKAFEFEEEFRRLISGCRCKVSNQDVEQDCYLSSNRETLSLTWCYLYLQGEESKSNDVMNYQRSELKSSFLTDIEDVLVGNYRITNDDTEQPQIQSKILQIRFKLLTLEFIFPDESNREDIVRFERWIQSLISVRHFLSIPVIIF